MDLSKIDLKTVFGIAVKSEIESRKVYEDLAERTKNFFLKDRLLFLAGEEKKHKELLEKLFKDCCPTENLTIPEGTPVPLPKIEYDSSTPASEIIEQAMEAELAAKDFYLSAADQLSINNHRVYVALHYLASMEETHYIILKKELEMQKEFEDYDVYWEMMHVGP